MGRFMVRILVVITTSFVPYGGLASVMMNFYRAIDKTRFHIDFASTNLELNPKLALELKQNGSKYYGLGNRKKFIINYAKSLDRVLKNGKYDVIHVNSNSATATLELLVAYKNGIQKRIVHNHTSICDHKILNNLLKPVFNKLYTDAVACSDKAGKWLFTNNDFRVLNNGINADKFAFNASNRTFVRDKYHIDDSKVVLGHVGKIYKPKNHLYLINVFNQYLKRNNNAILLLVGDGVMRKKVETEVKSLGIECNVIFAGMQTNVEAYLSAMDYFVFPSIWEGMPLSVIEAQAAGLNCFISDTIDSDVIVTKDVTSLPIIEVDEVWSSVIPTNLPENREARSKENIARIKEAFFDSNACCKVLEKIYLKPSKEEKEWS